MRRVVVVLLILVFATASIVSAQPAKASEPRSNKGRIIGTLAGLGGGFLLGLLGGLAWYDDAVHSDRKVTTAVVVFSAAGAVGGYFIGNAIDKRGSRTASVRTSRELPLPSHLPRLRPPVAASPAFPWASRVGDMALFAVPAAGWQTAR